MLEKYWNDYNDNRIPVSSGKFVGKLRRDISRTATVSNILGEIKAGDT